MGSHFDWFSVLKPPKISLVTNEYNKKTLMEFTTFWISYIRYYMCILVLFHFSRTYLWRVIFCTVNITVTKLLITNKLRGLFYGIGYRLWQGEKSTKPITHYWQVTSRRSYLRDKRWRRGRWEVNFWTLLKDRSSQ